MGLRLDTLLAAIPPDAALLDVGADHGLLAVAHARRDPRARAIASDLRPGPLAGAARLIAESGLQARVTTRLGDGLSVVEPGEVDAVCAAGFGGAEIARVLEAGRAVLAAGVGRVVVQPLGAEPALRRTLRDLGLHLRAEHLVHDSGFDYVLEVAVPGDGDDPAYGAAGVDDAVAMLVGPLLLRDRPAGLREWVLARHAHAARVAQSSAGSPRAEFTRQRLAHWAAALAAW